VKRPMMIDAIAKRNAAAKVKAIKYTIALLPKRRRPPQSLERLIGKFPRGNEVISQCGMIGAPRRRWGDALQNEPGLIGYECPSAGT
jgi:hypothetical protein